MEKSNNKTICSVYHIRTHLNIWRAYARAKEGESTGWNVKANTLSVYIKEVIPSTNPPNFL